jgi:hypothetical protein
VVGGQKEGGESLTNLVEWRDAYRSAMQDQGRDSLIDHSREPKMRSKLDFKNWKALPKRATAWKEPL